MFNSQSAVVETDDMQNHTGGVSFKFNWAGFSLV
jgi:hypothetical protein